jgi:cell division septum initiation protein DivIVA
LQTEIADLRTEIASLRDQLATARRLDEIQQRLVQLEQTIHEGRARGVTVAAADWRRTLWPPPLNASKRWARAIRQTNR